MDEHDCVTRFSYLFKQEASSKLNIKDLSHFTMSLLYPEGGIVLVPKRIMRAF